MNEKGYGRLHIPLAGFGRRILLPLFVCLAFFGQGCTLIDPPGSREEQAVFFADGNSARSESQNKTEPGRTEEKTELDAEPLKAVSAAKQQEAVQEADTEAADSGFVHIYGAVMSPGVYGIRPGMRLFELIEAAGGFTSQADETWLNLASPVLDGQQIRVPTKQEAGQLREQSQGADSAVLSGLYSADPQAGTAPAVPDAADGGTQTARVNINTASLQELTTLPGIGQTRARAVLEYRQAHGAFRTIEEICSVSGIKQATFEKLKDLITV